MRRANSIEPRWCLVLKVIIRRAAKEDLGKMIDLAAASVDSSIPPSRDVSPETVRAARIADLESSLPQLLPMSHMGLFVAEDENGVFLGHVMGYLGDTESVTGERQGWIFDMSVVEKYRGMGVGTQLMNHFVDFVRKAGFQFVGLLVTSANDKAVSFYERLGFVEERKRMAKRLS